MNGNKTVFRWLALSALAVLFGSSVARADLLVGVTPDFATGGQEVPAVVTSAVGAAVLNVDSDTGNFDFDLFVSGITPAVLDTDGPNAGSPAVHIRNAAPGATGPIVVDVGFQGTVTPVGSTGFHLTVSGGSFGGTQGALVAPDFSTLIPELLAGNLYVNVETSAHGGGEVRGQIAAVPEPASLALALACGMVGLAWRRWR